MRKLFPFAFCFLHGCISKKEYLIGQQEFVKEQMDSVDVYRGSTIMLIQEYNSDKKRDSIIPKDYYKHLQGVYEEYNTYYRKLRRQYDSLELEIQKH